MVSLQQERRGGPLLSLILLLVTAYLTNITTSPVYGLQITVTPNPPLLDVPVFSLATVNADGCTTTNMNILTYATPVSISPHRLWTLGLYKDTRSHANLCQHGTCVLQLLTEEHIPLVKLLGGSSGKDVNKQIACSNILPNLAWQKLQAQDKDDDKDDGNHDDMLPLVLPKCAYYLKLSVVGEIMDGGSHDIAVCKVQRMWAPQVPKTNDNNGSAPLSLPQQPEYLSTGRLRALGIITEQGRVTQQDGR